MRHTDTEMEGRQDEIWYPLDNPSEYWRGRVVSSNHRGYTMFGHIMGFGRSADGEVNILVLWEDGPATHIHPGYLTLH